MIVFAIVQVILILLFVLVFVQREEADDTNTLCLSTCVEKIEYIPMSGRYSKFSIFSENIKYSLDLKLAQNNGYSAEFLEKSLEKENVTIVCKEEQTIYGKKNKIVSISTEKDTIYSISDYNKEQRTQRNVGIIVLSVFQFLLIVAFVGYMFFEFRL